MDAPHLAVTPLRLSVVSLSSLISLSPTLLFLGGVSSIMHVVVVLLASLSFRTTRVHVHACVYDCSHTQHNPYFVFVYLACFASEHKPSVRMQCGV